MPPFSMVAVAALSGVVTGFLLGRALGRTKTEADEAPAQAFACDGCAKTFRTEADAILHAMDEHRAPDRENARYIIDEVEA